MTSLPAYCRPVALEHFASALHNRPLDEVAQGPCYRWLFEAAWAIACHELPDVQLSVGQTAIENLGAAVRSRTASRQSAARLAHLHDVLFEVLGLRGNEQDYFEAANSYLPAVLSRRSGIPISLALVYACVASDLGIEVYGVNAPGHFLVEVIEHREALTHARTEHSMYVDPFYGGGILNQSEALERIVQATGRQEVARPDYLHRATPRQWLTRMLMNLQAIFSATNRQRDLYAMQELQQCLEVAS